MNERDRYMRLRGPAAIISFIHAQIKRNNPTRQNKGTEVYTWSASTFYLFFGRHSFVLELILWQIVGNLGKIIYYKIHIICYTQFTVRLYSDKLVRELI